MSKLSNSVQLIGRVGKDVEIINLENGNKLAKCSLATSDYYKNSKGEKIVDTQWHNIIAWGATAEHMGNLLMKGNEVIIKGKLNYSKYDKEGVTRYITDIVAHEFYKTTKKEVVPF